MNKEINKSITHAWIAAFPGLKAYGKNKLYKVIGPFVLGIELIGLPYGENYRPHFVIYPLYKKDVKDCLKFPYLIFEFYNNKKLQINLPYDDATEKYKEAHNIIHTNLDISLDTNVPLESFFKLIDNTVINDTAIQRNPGRLALLLEIKLYAALYIESSYQVDKVMNEIQDASNNWDRKVFESWHGDLDAWIAGLTKLTTDNAAFFNQVEINMQDKKISKLQYSTFLP